MASRNACGMGNWSGAKSPTVRLHTAWPRCISWRISAAILRISEPTRPWATGDRPARAASSAAVPQAGVDVERLPRQELDGPALLPVLEVLKQQPPGQDHDGLVLLYMVLERQPLPLLDVQDLADVAVGVGPDQLMAPGFVHGTHP